MRSFNDTVSGRFYVMHNLFGMNLREICIVSGPRAPQFAWYEDEHKRDYSRRRQIIFSASFKTLGSSSLDFALFQR